MAKVDTVLEVLNDDNETVANCSTEILNVSNLGDKIAAWIKRVKKPCRACCCLAHCSMQSHGRSARNYVSVHRGSEVEFNMFDNSWHTSNEYEELLENQTMIRSSDGLTSLLCATQLDLDLETL